MHSISVLEQGTDQVVPIFNVTVDFYTAGDSWKYRRFALEEFLQLICLNLIQILHVHLDAGMLSPATGLCQSEFIAETFY